jgi:hypothetical protein
VPPELLLATVLLAGYGVAVLVLAPEYAGLVSRLGATYWDYVRRPLGTILAGTLSPLTVLGALLLWPVTRRLTRYPALADLLGIATLGLFVAVVLQHKGFGYHYYPALGTGLLGLLLGVLGGAPSDAPRWLPAAGRAASVLVAQPWLVLFLTTAMHRAGGSAARSPVAAGSREVGAFLRANPPAGPVVIYSPWMDDAFPLVLEAGVEWASRYPFMWFMPALYRQELAVSTLIRCRRPAERSPAERELVATVTEDLKTRRPDLVFVRRPGDTGLLRMDLLACFGRDGEFRREFAAYRRVGDLEHFRVFQRRRG